MIDQHRAKNALRGTCASLAAVPLILFAQTPAAVVEQDWRGANDTVGRLERGHIDVLKWENANATSLGAAADEAPARDFKLPTADDAVRQAWRAHRDLAGPLARLGTDTADAIAAGRWLELDPVLQRQVDDLDELLAVAAEARTAWLQAVAARQVLQHRRSALTAADAANELGLRMVSTGNWSRLQHTEVQLARSDALMKLTRAEYAAARAEFALLEALQLDGVHTGVGVPDRLPAMDEMPTQILTEDEFTQRLAALHAYSPGAERRRSAAAAPLAFAAYRATHAIALASADEAAVRGVIAEETVLHYNGMLKSVWDVLATARSQSEAAISQIGAQRDFLVAEIDLLWVLQGGMPTSLVSLGSGDAGPGPAAAAH